MIWRVRYTAQAREDLHRLYSFLLEQDLEAAERALTRLDQAVDLLRTFPFACRRANPDNPLLRELLVSFGTGGYVLLYEIDGPQTVTILAVRHQREDDYP